VAPYVPPRRADHEACLDAAGWPVTVIAMPHSGEVFITRAADRQYRLHSPAQIVLVSEERAERLAVEEALVNQMFLTWKAFENFRQRRAAFGARQKPRKIDLAQWDDARIERTLPIMEHWLDTGKAARTARLAEQLVDLPVCSAETRASLAVLLAAADAAFQTEKTIE
jgi:hypothetical protein